MQLDAAGLRAEVEMLEELKQECLEEGEGLPWPLARRLAALRKQLRAQQTAARRAAGEL